MDINNLLIVFVFIFILFVVVCYSHIIDFIKEFKLDYIDNYKIGNYIGGNYRKKKKNTDLKIKDLTIHPRSKSEQEVINYLELATGKSFPTAYPKWLVWKGKNLELDGYNEELGVGLEFSGPLHTKWYPEKESYVKYFERVTNDIVKNRLCKKHGVKLMLIDYNLPRIHWKNYILSRLYDFGIHDKPIEYIETQKVKPFRNKELERELNLTEEYIAAKRI